MSIARPSQIVGVNVVRMDRAIHDRSDGSRTDQKTVVVVVNAGIVLVVVEAEFRGVSLGEEILHVQIGDVDLLSAILECVQSAIGIFFEKMKPCEVVGQSVGAQIPEKSHPGLLFRKKKTAKIAGELLDSRSHRNKIIIWTEVV